MRSLARTGNKRSKVTYLFLGSKLDNELRAGILLPRNLNTDQQAKNSQTESKRRTSRNLELENRLKTS
uniref:Uncharacterized protein n=1 Tax=Solanum tuberosum TaxID=4113 RepID=M0ZTX1_SOLTU